MNTTDKANAIRTLVERRITEHAEVIPTRYLSFGLRLPWIYRGVTGPIHGVSVTLGLPQLGEATVHTVGAYERK